MPGEPTDANVPVETPVRCTGRDDDHCGADLTAADYVGMQRPTDDPALPDTTGTFAAFDCDDCGHTHYVCTVCTGGSFRTDEGRSLICHNCKPAQARRQDEQHRRRQPPRHRR